MKVEKWNGYKIRFIEKDGDWWAVGKDVCKALGLKQATRALKTLKGVTKCKVLTDGGYQDLNIINAKSIYKLAFKSRKKEAEEFQDWVVDVIDGLRLEIGLEGFQVFRMFDKEHQNTMNLFASTADEPIVKLELIFDGIWKLNYTKRLIGLK